MICGTPAFPFTGDSDEHKNRIKNGIFNFADEKTHSRKTSQTPRTPRKDNNLSYSEISHDGKVQDVVSNQSEPFTVSKEAKSLIRALITHKSRKRLPIHKIKAHPFFKEINWNNVENGKVRMPKVELREPESNDFDAISFDSDDEDFEHEYT